jgi:hypothetical protein
MRGRRHWIVGILLFGVAALIGGSIAAAQSSSAGTQVVEHAKATYRMVEFRTSPDYPAVGSKAVYTGVVKRTIGGKQTRGSAIAHNTITGYEGNVVTSKSKINSYYPAGQNRHRGIVRATFQPDGSIKLEGEGVMTGGSARWRGLTGSYTTAGEQSGLGQPLTFEARATLKRPK